MKQTYTRFTAGLLAFAVPVTAIAAGVLSVDDSIAGLGLDVDISGSDAQAQFSVQVTAPDGDTVSLPITTNAKGDASVTVPGTKTETAGTYTVSVLKNGTTVLSPVTAEVEADTMDPWTSGVQVWTPRIHADGHDEADIAVTLRDRYGNVLAGRPVSLVSSRTTDYIEAETPETDAKGTQYFALTTEEPGMIQLRAVDLLTGNAIIQSGEIEAEGYGMGGHDTRQFYDAANANSTSNGGRQFYNNTSYNAQVTSPIGVLDHFVVTAPATMTPGEEAPKITIRAVDRDEQTVEDYTGTIRFQTTDPNATVPNFGEYTFQSRDLGVKSFTLALKFQASGEQILRIEDINDDRIFGEATIMVGVGGGGSTSNGIEVTSHQNNDYVNTLEIVVEGRGPRYANLIVMGGEQDATGGTDGNGAFSIPVQLNPGQRDYTIRVMDAEDPRTDSGPIHLILDQVVPTIDSITFTPDDPETDEKVLVVIESEPNLAQALLRLTDNNGTVKELALTPIPSQSGSYQTFFTAPEAGTYQPTIVVMDRAGNTEEVRAQLNVGGKTLPKVENVKAQATIDAVELEWEAVTEATGYRVYIGETPTNYLYSLDTGRVTTKATVKGLTPGKIYYFAVTATQEGSESAEKSDPVQAQVLGFALKVEAEENALHVTWNTLSDDLPLSAFKLEYGTEQNALSEERMINGELRDFTIRDLLPGIEYFVKVTPVTVTADSLDELAATGQGTPTGDGFTAGPRDDIPFDTRPGDTLHPAPGTPESGIPAFAWMAALILGAAGVLMQWNHRRKVRETATFLQAVQAQYRTV